MRRVELNKVKIALKGLIVVDKRRLEVNHFLLYNGQFFEVFGPKTYDANIMEQKKTVPQATGKYCSIF